MLNHLTSPSCIFNRKNLCAKILRNSIARTSAQSDESYVQSYSMAFDIQNELAKNLFQRDLPVQLEFITNITL